MKSLWDDSQPQTSRPYYPRIPRDISPALAWRVIQFARMMQRAEPGTVFLVTRAIEADVMKWEEPTRNKPLDGKRNPL